MPPNLEKAIDEQLMKNVQTSTQLGRKLKQIEDNFTRDIIVQCRPNSYETNGELRKASVLFLNKRNLD